MASIKNYTSKTSPLDSIGQMQTILAEHGASKIMIDYDQNRKPCALSFIMMINESPVPFRLTVNVEGLQKAIRQDSRTPNTAAKKEQAERTAWKNKLEWLRLQLVEIQTHQAEMTELLLGYVVTDNGQTAHERMKSNTNFLLE